MFSVVPKFLIKKGASAKSFNYFEKKYLTNCKSYHALIEKYFKRKEKLVQAKSFHLINQPAWRLQAFFFGGGPFSTECFQLHCWKGGGCSKRATSKWPKAQTLHITPPPHLLSCTNTRLYLHDVFSASNYVILGWVQFNKVIHVTSFSNISYCINCE